MTSIPARYRILPRNAILSLVAILTLASCGSDRVQPKRDIRSIGNSESSFSVSLKADYLGEVKPKSFYVSVSTEQRNSISNERYELYIVRALEEAGFKVVVSEIAANFILKYKIDDSYFSTKDRLVSVPIYGATIDPHSGRTITGIVGAGSQTVSDVFHGGSIKFEGFSQDSKDKFEVLSVFLNKDAVETDVFVPYVITGAVHFIGKRRTVLEESNFSTNDKIYMAITQAESKQIDGLLPEFGSLSEVKIESNKKEMADIAEVSLKHIGLSRTSKGENIIAINRTGVEVKASLSRNGKILREIKVESQQTFGFDEYEMTNLALSVLVFGAQ